MFTFSELMESLMPVPQAFLFWSAFLFISLAAGVVFYRLEKRRNEREEKRLEGGDDA